MHLPGPIALRDEFKRIFETYSTLQSTERITVRRTTRALTVPLCSDLGHAIVTGTKFVLPVQGTYTRAPCDHGILSTTIAQKVWKGYLQTKAIFICKKSQFRFLVVEVQCC